MNLRNDFAIKGRWWIPDAEGKGNEEIFGELIVEKSPQHKNS